MRPTLSGAERKTSFHGRAHEQALPHQNPWWGRAPPYGMAGIRLGLQAPAGEVPQDDGDRFRSLEGPRRTREPPRGCGPHNDEARGRPRPMGNYHEALPPTSGSGWACKRPRGRSRRTTGTGSGLWKVPGGRGNLPADAAHAATKLGAGPPASSLGVCPGRWETIEGPSRTRRRLPGRTGSAPPVRPVDPVDKAGPLPGNRETP